ncbi:replicative DNA helicase [Flagellimonas sp. S174]|uniref:replicative DNA helicase n=1 Tax=Flagellimonas sp. S174 TaxID=3410790 RepID=UPI003BF543EA
MSGTERGKIPPQAIDLEKAVLGAMMLDQKGVDGCLEVIKSPEVFYSEKHRQVFIAIQQLDSENSPVDLLTVSQTLRANGKLEAVGGDFALVELTQKVAGSAHIEYHSYVLLQKFIKRQLISIGNEAIEKGYEEGKDVFEALDEVTVLFDSLSGIYERGGSSIDWNMAIEEVPRRVERLTNNQGELTGVDTGLTNINKHFNGWQPTDLIIIGADSGMGKTALAMTHILASAKEGNAVGMASMEMSTMQLAIRGVAVESQFHMRQLTQTGFEKDEYFVRLSKVVDRMRNLPIYIDDRPSLTVAEMKRKARQMKRRHDIKLFIADFIQMFAGDEDDFKLTGMAARELKNLAKELDIPVIALSQLNREVKKARYSVPSKHHLKNSSGVEEAADVIGLLYRPEYYGHNRDSAPDLWNDLQLENDENAVLIVAKNRNGGLGNIPLKYIANKTKYVNPGEWTGEPENDGFDIPKMGVDEAFGNDDKTVFDAE